MGPLYNQHPDTKEYFVYSGQSFINSGLNGGTLYFMTGKF